MDVQIDSPEPLSTIPSQWDHAPELLLLKAASNLSLVGGKAINLAKLMKAGLPVPNGFVITTKAYRNAEDGKVTPELAKRIAEALQIVSGQLFAVRSSATAEDMKGASMAGQYETFLNLRSAEEVVDAIEKCWKSIHSDRSQAYLKEHHLNPNDVDMAVVVQQLVKADVSGVLFSIDPKDCNEEEMLLEATWGLGESLVSGLVQPDVIKISKHTNSVSAYTIGKKDLALYSDSFDLKKVEDHQQARACLNFQQVIHLKELGLKAEKYFGQPQDLEWAIEGTKLFLLQSRPITTLEDSKALKAHLHKTKSALKEASHHGAGPWVRHNLGETLPHPTPFTWCILKELMSGLGGYGQMLETLGFKPSEEVQKNGFLKKVCGEIYMDCSAMPNMFQENFPYAYDIELLKESPDAAQQPPSIPNGSYAELRAAAELSQHAHEKVSLLSKDLDHLFDHDFLPELNEWCETQESLDLAAMPDDVLEHLWNHQTHKVLGKFTSTTLLPSMIEAAAVADLKTFLQEYCWDEDPNTLLTKLSVSPKPDQTLKSNIALRKCLKGKEAKEDWLKHYGHRAPTEFELSEPRWKDRLEELDKMIQHLDGGVDLELLHREQLEAAELCHQEVLQKLPQHLHESFKIKVQLLQRYIRFREDGKFYLMKAYSHLRTTALEIGRRLNLDGDIFYLKPEEALRALKTKFIPMDKIEERKLEMQLDKRLSMPHVIEISKIDHLGEKIERHHGASLKAHSVSGGLAFGRVKIVHKPGDISELPKNTILVCPSTDPSWTPLFLNACGLIIERGGSLSHGAVVARELGLPAVVLDGATEIFSDGEEITIDANRNVIYKELNPTEQQLHEDPQLPYQWQPPIVGQIEKQVFKAAGLTACLWVIVLSVMYLIPESILLNPTMSFLDSMIWPIIRSSGMVGTVAWIAVFFGIVPIILQRLLTDNHRLLVAKQRSNFLLSEAQNLPKNSARRQAMEALAKPFTMRILKMSLVPLMFLLGPMIVVFMWFPSRVDPISWNAEPGRMVSIVAEVDGEWSNDITLQHADALHLDENTLASQSLQPIRKELEDLQRSWRQPSEAISLPWDIQAAGDHAREVLNQSLKSFLNAPMPSQKITWLLNVPESATGLHKTQIKLGKEYAADFTLHFGKEVPPPPATILPLHDSLKSIKINYPRALQKESFWTPLSFMGMPNFDFTWLGVYLIVYIPVMFLFKFLLRVP